MMNIDSYYTNGKAHGHRGEDYALHGDNYFIICDGCSSGKNSDIAARLQAHIAAKSIYTAGKISNEFMIESIAAQLRSTFWSLGLKDSPLATLMIGFFIDDKVRVVTVGDGVIVSKYKNNQEKLTKISFEEANDFETININAPYYPIYTIDDSLARLYKYKFPNTFQKISTNEISGEFVELDFSSASSVKAFDYELKNLEYVYVFSDGIDDIQSAMNGKISLPDAVSQFTAMKNTNGTFIERRCKRQFKLFEKEKTFPIDDFSMAGYHV